MGLSIAPLFHRSDPGRRIYDMEFQESEERRPLLAPNRPRTGSVAKRTPLPYGQLGLLCLVRFVDPIVFTFVFPFMNQVSRVSSDLELF